MNGILFAEYDNKKEVVIIPKSIRNWRDAVDVCIGQRKGHLASSLNKTDCASFKNAPVSDLASLTLISGTRMYKTEYLSQNGKVKLDTNVINNFVFLA